MAVTTDEIQTRIHLEELNNNCFILCMFFSCKRLQEGVRQVKQVLVQITMLCDCNTNCGRYFILILYIVFLCKQASIDFWQIVIRINGHE